MLKKLLPCSLMAAAILIAALIAPPASATDAVRSIGKFYTGTPVTVDPKHMMGMGMNQAAPQEEVDPKKIYYGEFVGLTSDRGVFAITIMADSNLRACKVATNSQKGGMDALSVLNQLNTMATYHPGSMKLQIYPAAKISTYSRDNRTIDLTNIPNCKQIHMSGGIHDYRPLPPASGSPAQTIPDDY